MNPDERMDAEPTRGMEAETEGRRARKKAENRATLLAAALEVFTTMGYEAATVRDIVRATDLSPGTFYNYFQDKRAILLDLLNENLGRLNASARTARRQAKSAEAFVRDAYRATFEHVAGDPAAFRLMRRNHGAIRALLGDSIHGASVRELEEDVAEAIERGVLPQVDVGFLTAALAGIGLEVAVRMAEREPLDLEDAITFASDLVIGGLKAASRSS